MRHFSILEYAKFRWFKLAVLLCAAAGAAYIWHEPPLKAYGGTPLGYTLGTIGALLILWLLAFGIRKRRYTSTLGTLQGWLSAHVYLGVALVVIVTLHTGFELGWNIHTLAYVLMIAVVVSGLYGVVFYVRVPPAITANLGEDTLDSILLRVGDIDRDVREKALSLPDNLMALVDRSVKETRLGGSAVRLLTGRDPSCPTYAAIERWAVEGTKLKGDAAKTGKDVYGLLLEKHELLQRARRDMKHKALLDLWLYFHVPLAFALLAALAAHVISVFIYW